MTAAELRAAFEAPEPLSVGLEEEVMLLDPETFLPAPVGAEVVGRAASERVKVELPAAQVEVLTRPHARVADAIGELRRGRAELAAAAAGLALPAAAAVHPLSVADAELNADERYRRIEEEYGAVARRQLVGALQVHVAVGGADRTLAVYNALRGLLPELAALAAAAPFFAGRDTGLASVRPLVSALLPRQGVPPAFTGWEEFAEALAWAGDRDWWWELRPHRRFGTLELRVPDVQPSIAGAQAVALAAHAVVAWLAARHDAGEALGAPARWRIEENRWSALRHGVEGSMADLVTGERRPTRELLLELLDAIEPHAQAPLGGARALVARNAALELRGVGVRTACEWLTGAFRG